MVLLNVIERNSEPVVVLEGTEDIESIDHLASRFNDVLKKGSGANFAIVMLPPTKGEPGWKPVIFSILAENATIKQKTGTSICLASIQQRVATTKQFTIADEDDIKTYLKDFHMDVVKRPVEPVVEPVVEPEVEEAVG